MGPHITASQLLSHLACPHRLVMDATGDPSARDPVSPFVQMLWQRGVAHEHAQVALQGAGLLDLSALRGDEKESATREAIARREPLIRGGRLSVHGLLGEPDLLRFEHGGYVAVDIKSGSARAGEGDDGALRTAYGVQLALYTDILEQMGLSPGRYGYILDVRGDTARYDLAQPTGPRSPCLWEVYLKTRQAVRDTLAHPASSRPALCSACKLCVWRSACLRRLEAARDLSLLPELGRRARDTLAEEFPTIEALAAARVERYIDGARTTFPRIGPQTLRRFQRRAALAAAPAGEPYLTRQFEWPVAEVEIFFDVETDPLRGLCYLHGLLLRERGVGERFVGLFAATPDAAGEREMFAAAMAVFRRHPQALVIHYSPYERTTYRQLAARYPEVASADEIEALFATPRALDLYADVVRPGSEWPTRDFSVKSLAKYRGFRWRDSDPSGAASIEWFDQWATSRSAVLKKRLLDYNEDDCIAMRVVWDTLRQLPVQ